MGLWVLYWAVFALKDKKGCRILKRILHTGTDNDENKDMRA